MSATTKKRPPAEVLDDHLRESLVGNIEADLTKNYARDVIVLTSRGVYRGHDGLRKLAELLRIELPNTKFIYGTRLL